MAEKLVKQLEKAVDAQDEAKSANLIERILSTDAGNAYALHCKAVLSIHLGKYEAALAVMVQLAAADPSYHRDDEYLFQKSYCLYRLQRLAEAREIASGVNSVPARHLLAQIAYNLEEYETAAAIYERLLEEGAARDDQERQELITNLSAAYVTIDAKKAADAVRKADEKTADMLFNAATAELEGRQYDQAMATLAKAEQLALRSHTGATTTTTVDQFSALNVLPPKSPERTLFEELSPLWVQRAYLHYAKGEEDVSASILATILKHKVASVAVSAVASINWAAIKRHKDFFDTHRKLKQVQTPAMFSRLTTKQKLLVKYNTAMLLLNTGKLAACKQIAESLIVEHPKSELGSLLLLAANVRSDSSGSKQKKGASSKVDDLLTTVSSRLSSGGKASQARCTIAQIRFEQGDISGCLHELAQLEGVETRIGYAVTASEWYMRIGEFDKALDLVRACLNTTTDPRSLITFAARSFIRFAQYESASSVLQLATGKVKDDVEVQALSAIALSRTNIAAAIAVAKHLPAPPNASLSGEQLFASIPSRSAVEAAGFKRTGDDAADDAKRIGKVADRRARPLRRKAKNFNKDVRPDPERWVPMAMRLSVKDMPERRKKDLKRLRASEQADKRKAAEKRKQAAAAAAATVA